MLFGKVTFNMSRAIVYIIMLMVVAFAVERMKGCIVIQ